MAKDGAQGLGILLGFHGLLVAEDGLEGVPGPLQDVQRGVDGRWARAGELKEPHRRGIELQVTLQLKIPLPVTRRDGLMQAVQDGVKELLHREGGVLQAKQRDEPGNALDQGLLVRQGCRRSAHAPGYRVDQADHRFPRLEPVATLHADDLEGVGGVRRQGRPELGAVQLNPKKQVTQGLLHRAVGIFAKPLGVRSDQPGHALHHNVVREEDVLRDPNLLHPARHVGE
mmetsp:Transcript_6417/g.22076  ORF Transcript_6417/g.22076 Transcript_6417/m.22076 type:complete len:228 (+) Transcript_6417:858-1541(+)